MYMYHKQTSCTYMLQDCKTIFSVSYMYIHVYKQSREIDGWGSLPKEYTILFSYWYDSPTELQLEASTCDLDSFALNLGCINKTVS